MTLWNSIGTLGAIAIILAYALNQFSRWQTTQLRYSACNAFGAGCILISLVAEPNLPSLIIESFWLLISLAAIVRQLRTRWHAKKINEPY